MTYILSPSLFLLSITTVALIIALLYSRASIKSLSSDTSKYQERIEILNTEKLENLEKIQHLSTTLQLYKEKFSSEAEVSKALLQSTENTLAELCTKLTTKLLSAHQHETKTSQIQYDQKISKTTQELKNEVQKLLGHISTLEKEVEKSGTFIEDLKLSLLSPTYSCNLTEITLLNILSSSGLNPDIDFKTQYTLKDADKIYRPDVVIFLPNNNFMIVDAKASKLLNLNKQDNETDNKDELLVKSLNRHLKSLSGKGYDKALRNNMTDDKISCKNVITLMFLHTESLVERINSLDNSFLPRAWNANIFPVGPTGLMNMLYIVKRQIAENKQILSYNAILNEVSTMLNSISDVAEQGNKIGSNISNLCNNYDRLSSIFNKNLSKSVERLAQFGIQSKKPSAITKTTPTRYLPVNINNLHS
ncbi:DNA recombination protein RmuC [Candidatus Sneabacter namystus]|uniref:DNA recombination protein RmuC homolog n=1 Tax=Candidatus Sneabacter namystus TaxID=2601646 RepID=A0A5C0UHR9_9RICK|nr:DNA recombination protein RmuC [Candidatus Sneabacter namystus]QEK39586.1 DNA recombination protein RmuC [Candidatus Sneabacter namystus]